MFYLQPISRWLGNSRRFYVFTNFISRCNQDMHQSSQIFLARKVCSWLTSWRWLKKLLTRTATCLYSRLWTYSFKRNAAQSRIYDTLNPNSPVVVPFCQDNLQFINPHPLQICHQALFRISEAFLESAGYITEDTTKLLLEFYDLIQKQIMV